MNNNKTKVGFISLGCAKNQVDSELMIGAVTEAGFDITSDESQAEAIIINTCAFIESAKQEAIDTILEMASYKKPDGLCRALIVTGCLAQRYADDIRNELPEVDGIVGVNNCDDIVSVLRRCLDKSSGDEEANRSDISRRSDNSFISAVTNELTVSYMNGARVVTTPKGSAYLKVAEGCDNRCSYCAIPLIRGALHSRPYEDVIDEARRLALSGIKEINVIAQDTTRYGKDIYGSSRLNELLLQLNEINGAEWIRLLYMYPDEIDERLIDTIKKCNKLVRYFDLPLQHISEGVLKRMNRRGTPDEIRRVLSRFREEFPECVIRSSFIVGFPGETESDFEQLHSFIKEFAFERVGVFCYSPEEGTTASLMDGQIDENVAVERRDILMATAQRISREYNESRVGSIVKVLVEDVSDDGIFYVGRSGYEAPDADGKIYFTSEEPVEIGDMVNVRLVIADEYDMTGICV